MSGRERRYGTGALRGIELVTALIRGHYPSVVDDGDELPDKPALP